MRRCVAQCNRCASFLGTPFSRLCTFNVDFKCLHGHMVISRVLHAAANHRVFFPLSKNTIVPQLKPLSYSGSAWTFFVKNFVRPLAIE
jgi:hypothetical protein